MKARVPYIILAGLLVVHAGCNERLSESELFVGTWNTVRVVLNGGDITSFVLEETDIIARFGADRSFRLEVRRGNEEQDTETAGTYIVDERGKTLTLTVETDEGPANVAVAYRFENDDRIVLSFTSDGTLFEGPEGDIDLTIHRQ
jgi:hypothetical protein